MWPRRHLSFDLNQEFFPWLPAALEIRCFQSFVCSFHGDGPPLPALTFGETCSIGHVTEHPPPQGARSNLFGGLPASRRCTGTSHDHHCHLVSVPFSKYRER